EALGAWHDLDERAERGGALHGSFVRRAHLGLDRDRLHHLSRAFPRLRADRGDRDEAGIVHRDLGAALFLDATDVLSLRSDAFADLFGVDLDRDDARRE